jgi:hypothetical protein
LNHAFIRYAKIHGTVHRPWLTAWRACRPTKVAAIALANKLARIAWAIMAKGERYKEPAVPASSPRSCRQSAWRAPGACWGLLQQYRHKADLWESGKARVIVKRTIMALKF